MKRRRALACELAFLALNELIVVAILFLLSLEPGLQM